jgi:thiamine-monophosphate kinase
MKTTTILSYEALANPYKIRDFGASEKRAVTYTGSGIVHYSRRCYYGAKSDIQMPRESEIVRMIVGQSRSKPGTGIELGIGDDAAVLSADSDADLLFCSDLSVEGIHFRTEWAEPYSIGRKALAVTISDIAAMGGQARFALASVALPRGFSMDMIKELFAGMFDLAAALDFSLVGGDTSASPGSLFIDTSAIGVCGRGRAIPRSGARPGDLVFVTGELGGSALGLMLLQQGWSLKDMSEAPAGRAISARQSAIRRHLEPEPRMQAGRMIGIEGMATAMIDISDGLATDLIHLVESSACGAIVHADLMPVAESLRDLAVTALEISPLDLALTGGEEYELLFSSPPQNIGRIADLSERLQLPITRIGEITREPGLLLERDGQTRPIAATGFEHEI